MSREADVAFGAFKMKLAINGEIAQGDFPVAIISHGSGGTNLAYRSIAFALVKQGFVVGMPLHPLDNYQNNSAAGTTANWTNRPKHIGSTIDAILENQKVSGSLDENSVAIIGHSAGGYTALAVAGGVADTRHIIDLCKNITSAQEPFCGLVRENRIEPIKIDNHRDRRVKAVVLMAPVGVLFKSERSLSRVDIPVLLLNAEKDEELTEPFHSELIKDRINDSDKLTHRTIENAGHYSFITPFPDEMKGDLGSVGEDPAGFDRAAFHRVLGEEISSYLLEAMR